MYDLPVLLHILAGMAWIGGGFILGGAVSGRMEKQVQQVRRECSVAVAVMNGYLRIGWVEMAALVGIIALMIYKPI